MASKDLNINELYKQPFIVQLGFAALLTAVILGLGYFLIFSDQRAQLEAAKQEEVKLKEDFQKKAKTAAQLPALIKQLEQLEASFAVLLRQLPTQAEVPNLIQELHDAASANGMRLDNVLPQASKPDGPIEILPYKISLTGSHDQLSRFARDVGELSRIITLSEMQLKPHAKDTSLFNLTALANTYKAIEQNVQVTDSAEDDKNDKKKPAQAGKQKKPDSTGASKND